MAFLFPPGVLIEGPQLPELPCSGLFEVVEPISASDIHWQGVGVYWESTLCSPTVSGFIPNCPPSSYTKPVADGPGFCSASPFVVHGSYSCSTGGRPTSEAFIIATSRLRAWEQYRVEQILWTGVTENGQVNPSFSLGNDECGISPINLSPSTLNPVAAVSALEDFLSGLVPCGGVIHAPMKMAAFFSESNLVKRDGGQFYTLAGTPIVFGAGYPGTGPDGAVPDEGTTYIFATGPLVIVRSDIILVPDGEKEAINRNINLIEARAERFYAAGFDCGLGYVQTSLTTAGNYNDLTTEG